MRTSRELAHARQVAQVKLVDLGLDAVVLGPPRVELCAGRM